MTYMFGGTLNLAQSTAVKHF